MTAIEIYEKETGDIQPNDQIGHMQWHVGYVKWLEQQVVKLYEMRVVCGKPCDNLRTACDKCKADLYNSLYNIT